jgi:hypothetical protein
VKLRLSRNLGKLRNKSQHSVSVALKRTRAAVMLPMLTGSAAKLQRKQ